MFVFCLCFAGRSQSFHLLLTGKQEAPPNRRGNIGEAWIDLKGNVLHCIVSIQATFSLVSGSIAGPARPGQTGPTVFTLGEFESVGPDGNGSGPTYDGFSDFTLTSEQIQQFKSGLWYINITSTQYPAGEIRAQLRRVMPPPATARVTGNATAYLVGWQRLQFPLVQIFPFEVLAFFFPTPVAASFPTQAIVRAYDNAGGLVTSTRTDHFGDYTLNLPPGNFVISAYSHEFGMQRPAGRVELRSFFSHVRVDFAFGQ